MTIPSRSARYKLASPCRNQWTPNRCPPSCTPLARARTYGDWRTAATSHWWSWCRVAQSRCTAIFCICTVRRRTTGTRMGEKTVETNRRYEVEEGGGEREREWNKNHYQWDKYSDGIKNKCLCHMCVESGVSDSFFKFWYLKRNGIFIAWKALNLILISL